MGVGEGSQLLNSNKRELSQWIYLHPFMPGSTLWIYVTFSENTLMSQNIEYFFLN